MVAPRSRHTLRTRKSDKQDAKATDRVQKADPKKSKKSNIQNGVHRNGTRSALKPSASPMNVSAPKEEDSGFSPLLATTRDPSYAKDGIEVRIATDAGDRSTMGKVREATLTPSHNEANASTQAPKLAKSRELQQDNWEAAEPLSHAKSGITSNGHSPSKATHKIFDDQEVRTNQEATALTDSHPNASEIASSSVDNDNASEDEGPEIVTASLGQDLAKQIKLKTQGFVQKYSCIQTILRSEFTDRI